MNLLNSTQVLNGVRYKVTDLIEASKELEIFEIKVADIFIDYEAPNENTLLSFIEHIQRTQQSNLKHPIILSPSNFILDGKHRVAKAILNNMKTIKAVRFKELPDCGEYIID